MSGGELRAGWLVVEAVLLAFLGGEVTEDAGADAGDEIRTIGFPEAEGSVI